MQISELSPSNFSGAAPLRDSSGFISKKLSCESHSSNPIAPGFSGEPALTVPTCHFPKWPQAYPALLRICAIVVSSGRIDQFGVNVP